MVTRQDREGMLRLRGRIDDVLRDTLAARRQELSSIDPSACALVDELARLIDAGGDRLRPAFTYWGFRAGGGEDGPAILQAAAATELLHTMALIHDDLMDGTPVRRGVPASHVEVGVPLAILAGDLAAVFADQVLLGAGFSGPYLMTALERYHRMRVEMASGQYLDLTSGGAGAGAVSGSRRVAALKGGSYTVQGPLLIGAALAGAGTPVVSRLGRYGAPLGEAFQLLDDLRDGDAAQGITPEMATSLVREAVASLDADVLGEGATSALTTLAHLVVER